VLLFWLILSFWLNPLLFRRAPLPVALPFLMPFEVLHCALVLLGGCARLKGAEIATLPGLGIDLSRIEPILAGR